MRKNCRNLCVTPQNFLSRKDVESNLSNAIQAAQAVFFNFFHIALPLFSIKSEKEGISILQNTAKLSLFSMQQTKEGENVKCKVCQKRMSDILIDLDYEYNGVMKKAKNVPASLACRCACPNAVRLRSRSIHGCRVL